MLAFDVPQRNVDGAHRRAPHAGLGARVELSIELAPDALGFQRVLAAQERRHFTIDEFPNAETLRTSGEAVAGDVGIGFDANEDDARDDFFLQQRHFHRYAVQRRFDVRDLQIPPPRFGVSVSSGEEVSQTLD